MTHNPYTPPGAKVEEPPRSPQSASRIAKLSLGPRIILAVGWLVFCGGYSIWASFGVLYVWPGVLFGTVLVVASLGVLLRWRWSRWVIYAFVIWASGVWLTFCGAAFALVLSHWRPRKFRRFHLCRGSRCFLLQFGARTSCDADSARSRMRPDTTLAVMMPGQSWRD